MALFFCPNLRKGGDSLDALKADMPKTEMTTEYGKIMKEQEIKIMMNNNLNNGAANNNNNSNNGGFIMAQGTLTTMEAFAGTVKTAMEAHYGDGYRVTVQDVQKNNGLVLTGITILKKDCNIAPTIYLNQACLIQATYRVSILAVQHLFRTVRCIVLSTSNYIRMTERMQASVVMVPSGSVREGSS